MTGFKRSATISAPAGLPSPTPRILEKRLRRSTPRVAEGLTMRGLASGGIDISDGLAADLVHLLTQSRCGAAVYLERLPLSPALRALDDPDRRRALALAGRPHTERYPTCDTGGIKTHAITPEIWATPPADHRTVD